jgi:hypothetical protein
MSVVMRRGAERGSRGCLAEGIARRHPARTYAYAYVREVSWMGGSGGFAIVVPAKAGTSGRKVSAGLPEIPAFAGMTRRSSNRCKPSRFSPRRFNGHSALER